MRLIIERPAQEITLPFRGTVKKLLASQGINPETVLVVRRGELLAEHDRIEDSDEIRLLSVISGG